MITLPELEHFLKHHSPTCTVHLFDAGETRKCSCGLASALIEVEVVTALLTDLLKMRETQRDYFANRSPQALRDAKYWERKIDQTLQLLQLKHKSAQTQQPKLFGSNLS
jgi:hypothetical protein